MAFARELLSGTMTGYVKQATTSFITGDMRIDNDWDACAGALKAVNFDWYVHYYVDSCNAANAK